MTNADVTTNNAGHNKKLPELTPHQIARDRLLPIDERQKAAAAVIADRRPIKPSRQIVAGLYGVSISGIDKALNGSRRRQPRLAPETLSALQDLWTEVFFLAGIKYQPEACAREQVIAFERYLARWLTMHADVRFLAASGGSAALHATAVNALFALIEALVAKYYEQ